MNGKASDSRGSRQIIDKSRWLEGLPQGVRHQDQQPNSISARIHTLPLQITSSSRILRDTGVNQSVDKWIQMLLGRHSILRSTDRTFSTTHHCDHRYRSRSHIARASVFQKIMSGINKVHAKTDGNISFGSLQPVLPLSNVGPPTRCGSHGILGRHCTLLGAARAHG